MSSTNDKGKGISRRNFIKGTGAGALALGTGSMLLKGLAKAAEKNTDAKSVSPNLAKTSQKKGPYNMVFITTDQERYFSEFPKGTDFKGRNRLKNMGTSFEKHYTCANMCTSSRSVIYTGQHIPHTGMFDNTNCPWQPDMSTDIQTTGDMMKRAGYYTAYKGKVHLSRKVEPDGSGKMMDHAMEPYGFSDFNTQGDDYGHEHGGYKNDHFFAAEAVKWLRGKGAELSKDKKPWFLTVNLINPHDVMYFNTDLPGAHEQDNGKIAGEVLRKPQHKVYDRTYEAPLPDNLFQPMIEKGRPRAHYEYTRGWNCLLGKIPDKTGNWQRYRDYYFNCLKDADDQLVMVLDELENQGMLDNTIIVFTSDHGEMAGNHGLRGKGPFSYEENIHLPLYIVHPEHMGGRKCQAVTSHLDLAPTFCALAGIDKVRLDEITRDLAGRDLTELLDEPEKAGPNALREGALYCFNMFMTVDSDFMARTVELLGSGKNKDDLRKSGIKPDLSKRGAMRTVFDGRYKFTRYFSPMQHNLPQTLDELFEYNDVELYDLKNDPDEMHNLVLEVQRNKALILNMNTKLNKLISHEIGEDVGQELPKISGVDWAVTDFGH